jgi:hypothetical protein
MSAVIHAGVHAKTRARIPFMDRVLSLVWCGRPRVRAGFLMSVWTEGYVTETDYTHGCRGGHPRKSNQPRSGSTQIRERREAIDCHEQVGYRENRLQDVLGPGRTGKRRTVEKRPTDSDSRAKPTTTAAKFKWSVCQLVTHQAQSQNVR